MKRRWRAHSEKWRTVFLLWSFYPEYKVIEFQTSKFGLLKDISFNVYYLSPASLWIMFFFCRHVCSTLVLQMCNVRIWRVKISVVRTSWQDKNEALTPFATCNFSKNWVSPQICTKNSSPAKYSCGDMNFEIYISTGSEKEGSWNGVNAIFYQIVNAPNRMKAS